MFVNRQATWVALFVAVAALKLVDTFDSRVGQSIDFQICSYNNPFVRCSTFKMEGRKHRSSKVGCHILWLLCRTPSLRMWYMLKTFLETLGHLFLAVYPNVYYKLT